MRRTVRNLLTSTTAALALVAGLVTLPGVTGTAQAGDKGTGQDNIAGILPEPALQGANDFGCKPTREHPRPVVLVHGLGATATENWYLFAPYLASKGYCVFAKTYGQDSRYPGRGGVQPMERSAAELDAFVDEVRKATGAEKVDLVGHSEGGIMPRYYLRYLGGANEVEHFVGWAAPNHGTTISGLTKLRALYPGFDAQLAGYCGSCPQFMVGSEFLEKLNGSGDETAGDVKYTVLVTRYDGIVTPLETSFLSGGNVENIVIQDVNPAAIPEHASMAGDVTTWELTLAGLGHAEGGHGGH